MIVRTCIRYSVFWGCRIAGGSRGLANRTVLLQSVLLLEIAGCSALPINLALCGRTGSRWFRTG